MKIDQDLCVHCQTCVPYCPVGAIGVEDGVRIDQEFCVECGACLKAGVCPTDALFQPELEWPRVLRSQFSDPLVSHPSTGIKGRGTAEIKTNDVTGRILRGEVGFAIEVGRPGISASFADVEKVAVALAGKVEFEPHNPVSALLDMKTGRFKSPEVRIERVLSAIIECKTTEEEGLEILRILQKVSREIDTVFSLGVVSRCIGGKIPFKALMEAAGYSPLINGKLNLGLGRPLA